MRILIFLVFRICDYIFLFSPFSVSSVVNKSFRCSLLTGGLGACPTLHSCCTHRNWASMDNFGCRPATDLSMRECRIHIFVGKRPPLPKISYISSRYARNFWLLLGSTSKISRRKTMSDRLLETREFIDMNAEFC